MKRIVVDRASGGDVLITVRPKGTSAGDWIWLLFLAALVAAGTRTFPRWLGEAGWGTRIFFGFVALFVSITLLRMILGLFWKAAGREEVLVDEAGIETRHRCGPIRFAKRYARAEVSNLRARTHQLGTRAPKLHLASFDARGMTIDVGTQLTPEESSELAREIESAFRR